MIPGHPHTVQASDVPLYMRGLGAAIQWHLGQDGMDPTTYDPSGDLIPPSSGDAGGGFDLLPSIPAVTPIDTTMYDPTAGLTAPISNLSSQDQALATLYQHSVAAGTMTPGQASSAIAQLISSSTSAAKGLTTSPSPRVSVPAVPGATNALTASTVIPGVPNFVLLAAAAAAAFAMGSR
jgi:hypothetical protein